MLHGELRDAVRRLCRSPIFVLFALATLTMAVGVNTVLFSLSSAIVRGNLGTAASSELVSVYRTSDDKAGDRFALISRPDFESIRDDGRELFAGVLAFESVRDVVSSDGLTQMAMGEAVSSDYFTVLGITAACGRSLVPADAQSSSPVVVIGDRLWQSRFGRAPDVVGRSIRIGGLPLTVVGVAPPAFKGLFAPTLVPTEFWIPLETRRPRGTLGYQELQARDRPVVQVRARLKPQTMLVTAGAAMASLAAGLEATYPTPRGDGGPRTFHVVRTDSVWLHESMDRVALPLMAIATAFGLAVLLIACTNLASLVLARGEARTVDIALRVALGASPWRIVRLLLMDSLVLCVMGTLLAGSLAWSLQWYLQVRPPSLNGITLAVSPAFDLRVAGFALALTVTTTVLCGLWPAWRLSRPAVVPILQGHTVSTPRRRAFGLRNVLIVPQVAVSTLLLVTAGLFVHSNIESGREERLGFQPGQAVMAVLDVDRARAAIRTPADDGDPFGVRAAERVRTSDDAEARGRELYRRLLLDARDHGVGPSVAEDPSALRRGAGHLSEAAGVARQGHPLVSAVGLTDTLPLDGGAQAVRAGPTAHLADTRPNARFTRVSPGYFEAIGLPVLAGRDFAETDDARSRAVVIVSAFAASQLWPNGDAVGRTLFVSGADGLPTAMAVVGIVGDTTLAHVDEPRETQLYRPLSQDYAARVTIVARPATAGLPPPGGRAVNVQAASLLDSLATLVRRHDTDLIASEMKLVTTYLSERRWPLRVAATGLGALGMAGLLLAGVGLFGLMLFQVNQQRREIAVRMALGASRGQIIGAAMRDSLCVVGLGATIGAAASALAGLAMSRILYGIPPVDLWVFAVVIGVLSLVAVAASYYPARRAAATDPLRSLY